ncbi:hypothetical protein LKD81_13910 [Lachnospiraceae bacterium CLA-AA-H215]|uniref:Uncharacterized protein n=1 Tax=Hominifimenecus microfluidus TaxID=2885348 RepID=A0AAE3ECB0_9FIRM|nr:hypothetical protein [Hominifimenecus microfluidus]MCC2232078.1 hypothetical protein [Hominifimenecus microfluidus]
MDIRYRLYPYPVLAADMDDYIDSSFTFAIVSEKKIHEIKLSFRLNLKNDGLADLIQSGKAEYLIHIECPRTCYRHAIKTTDYDYDYCIPERKLNGRVSICAFIVAKQNLPAYYNHAFNTDYEGLSFSIDRGGILAIGGQYTFNVIKDMEDLARIPSIFTICKRAADSDNGMEIDMDGNKIAVTLSNDSFCRYKNLASELKYQPAFHSMLIMPALIYVFETLRREGVDNYNDKRWFIAISKTFSKYNVKLNAETLDNSPSYTFAQKILDMPVDRALNALAEWSDDESEDE